MLAIGRDNKIRIYELLTGNLNTRINTNGIVREIEYSPDGSTILASIEINDEQYEIQLYTRDGVFLKSYNFNFEIYDIEFSRDSKIFFLSGVKLVCIDIITDEQIIFGGFVGSFIVCSNDDIIIVNDSKNYESKTFKLLSSEDYRNRRQINLMLGDSRYLTIHPTKNILGFLDIERDGIYIYDFDAERLIRIHRLDMGRTNREIFEVTMEIGFNLNDQLILGVNFTNNDSTILRYYNYNENPIKCVGTFNPGNVDIQNPDKSLQPFDYFNLDPEANFLITYKKLDNKTIIRVYDAAVAIDGEGILLNEFEVDNFTCHNIGSIPEYEGPILK